MNAGVIQGAPNDVDEVALPELCCGDIDGDAHGRKTVALPGTDLTARLPHDPFSDRNDQPALFGQGYEVIGRDQTPLRVLPAKQRFGAAEPSGSRIDLGLIVQQELLALQ